MVGSLLAGPTSSSPAFYPVSSLIIQRGASCAKVKLNVLHGAFSTSAFSRLVCDAVFNHPTSLEWFHPCSGHVVVADNSSEECVALLSKHVDERLDGMARSSAWIVLGITLSGDEKYFISPSNDHTAADALDFCQSHSIINTANCVHSIVSQAQSQQATKVPRARVVHSAPDAWDTEPYPVASYVRHSMASEPLTWISPLAVALLCKALSTLSSSSSHRIPRSKYGVLWPSVDFFLATIVLAVCAHVGYAIVLDQGVFFTIQRLSSAGMIPAIVIFWTSTLLLLQSFLSGSSPSQSTRSPTRNSTHTDTHTGTHTLCPPAAASPSQTPAATPTATHTTSHRHTHRTSHTDLSRLDFLPALRGLASLSVFLWHCVGLFFPADHPHWSRPHDRHSTHDLAHAHAILRHPITRLLYAGEATVHFFMAINGLVQLHSYCRDRYSGCLQHHHQDTRTSTPRGRPRHHTHTLTRSLIARPFRLCGPLMVVVLSTWCAAKMGALSCRDRARDLMGGVRFGPWWVAPYLERARLGECFGFLVHIFAPRWTREGHVSPQEGSAWTMRPLFQGSISILMAAPILFSLRGEARAAVYAVTLSVLHTHHQYGQVWRSMLGGLVIMDAFNSTPALRTLSQTTPSACCVRVCAWSLRAFLACVWATAQQEGSPAKLRSDGAVCMLLLLRLTPQLCGAISRSTVLRWLGEMSFSMYLWHDFLLHSVAGSVFVACVGSGRVGYTLAAVAGCVCALFVTLCVCCVSVRYVERPLECVSRWVAGILLRDPQPEAEVNEDEAVVKGSEVYVGSEMSDGASMK